MGHASVRQSFDRYGKILLRATPREHGTKRLDAFCWVSDTEGRVAQLGEPHRRRDISRRVVRTGSELLDYRCQSESMNQ